MSIKSGLLIEDLSDHLPIFQITKYTQPQTVNKNVSKNVIEKRIVNDLSIATFKEKLTSFDWKDFDNNNNVNDCYDYFVTNFTTLFDDSCPKIKITTDRKAFNSKPWMTSSLINCCKKKNLLYKQFMRKKLKVAEKRYKNYKNKLTTTLRFCEKEHYSAKLECNKNDIKQTWNIINDLINKKKFTASWPSEFLDNANVVTGKKNIANGFNHYFANVGPELESKIKNEKKIDFKHYMDKTVKEAIFLTPVTAEEISDVVKNLKNKMSKDCDGINMYTVKNVISCILQPLLYIFNLSLQSGTFPDSMKIARIIPLFKAGDKQLFSNYRPVSLLSQFSKILEKIFHARLMKFLEYKNIIHPGQYGFQNQLSTVHAIMELSEGISSAIDMKKYTVGVFIDLKKAFDTINHSILIKKLENYGIRGIASNWIQSYLQNRMQYVSIDDVTSDRQLLKCGVPQGSVLGPALFIIYVNDMCNVSKILRTILFADDTNLFYSGFDIDNICKVLTNELKHLNDWFTVNKLSLNIKKTSFMIFSSRDVGGNYNICINGIQIDRVYVTKFLGVQIDSRLSWKHHVHYIKNKVSKSLGILYRVKHLLNSRALYSLYCSLILPYLSYCCEIWGNNYSTNLQPLILIQKKAMRIIEKTSYREHTRPIFFKYNTLELLDLVKLKTLLIMFKAGKNELPINILSCFQLVKVTHSHNTRQRNDFSVKYCRTKLKSFTISLVGPKLWNEISDNLKKVDNYILFKKLCKLEIIESYR